MVQAGLVSLSLIATSIPKKAATSWLHVELSHESTMNSFNFPFLSGQAYPQFMRRVSQASQSLRRATVTFQ